MIVWDVQRLPYRSRPGWDCINDHARCPVCAAHGEDNHGIDGGQAWFGVRTILPDGRHLAAVLVVLRADYPATVPAAARTHRPMGACLELHVQGDAVECAWSPGGRCSGEVESAFNIAGEIWGRHGSAAGGPDQPEALWVELGRWLIHQAELACGMAT